MRSGRLEHFSERNRRKTWRRRGRFTKNGHAKGIRPHHGVRQNAFEQRSSEIYCSVAPVGRNSILEATRACVALMMCGVMTIKSLPTVN